MDVLILGSLQTCMVFSCSSLSSLSVKLLKFKKPGLEVFVCEKFRACRFHFRSKSVKSIKSIDSYFKIEPVN